jgi:hypothetical protein
MSVAADNSSVFAGTYTGGAHTTGSHTVTGANTYALVAVLRAYGDLAQTYSVNPAFNGVPMTKIADSGASPNGWFNAEVWELVAPTTGAITWTYAAAGGDRSAIIIRTYTGVDQTTPRGTAVTGNGYNTAPSLVIGSEAGGLVSDFIGEWDVASTWATTGSNSLITHVVNASGGDNASSDIAGAASVTMSWAQISGKDWGAVAVPIKAASTYTPPVLPFMYLKFNPTP